MSESDKYYIAFWGNVAAGAGIKDGWGMLFFGVSASCCLYLHYAMKGKS